MTREEAQAAEEEGKRMTHASKDLLCKLYLMTRPRALSEQELKEARRPYTPEIMKKIWGKNK